MRYSFEAKFLYFLKLSRLFKIILLTLSFGASSFLSLSLNLSLSLEVSFASNHFFKPKNLSEDYNESLEVLRDLERVYLVHNLLQAHNLVFTKTFINFITEILDFFLMNTLKLS